MKNNRVFAFLNISGFALGFAVCMILALYIYKELTVDKGYTNHQNIYRLIDARKNSTWMDYNISGLLKEQYSEVQYATPVNYMSDEEPFTLKKIKDEEYILVNEVISTTNDFFKIFSVNTIASKSANPFSDLNSIVISKSVALKLFGKTDVIDEIVSVDNNFELPISAVVEDLPENSSLSADFYFNAENEQFRFSLYCRDNNCYNPLDLYVYTNKNTDIQHLTKKMNTGFPTNKSGTDSIRFQPVSDIYLATNIEHNANKAGSKGLLFIFLSIAIVILLMSVINYVNFSLSNQLATLKELGIKLINGAGMNYLRSFYLTEITLSVIISFVISIGITWLALPFASKLLVAPLKFEWLFLPSLLSIFTVVLFTIILITSIAPLYIISRFDVQRLFGKKDLHFGKQYGKRVLTVFQMAASIVLLICLVSIQKQLSYAKTTDLGFNKEQLVKLNIPDPYVFKNHEALKQQFANLSFVENTSYSLGGPGFINVGMGSNLKEGENFSLDCIYIDEDFLETFDISLIEGRELLKSDKKKSCYINQTAFMRYEWGNLEGKKFNNGRDGGYDIVGVVNDFHVKSFHNKITPVCLIYNDEATSLNIKLLPGDLGDQMSQIKETWKSFFPDDALNYQFYDAYFNALYKKEDRQGRAITLFSLIALIITCLGLLGQIVQTCIARNKEIGVRKVNGAKIIEIIALLNTDFIKWVIIAFIVASPAAYYAVNKWLQNFAYKTEISWWIFALAGAMALFIALVTVSWQSWRAASRNPVEALRYE